MGWEGQKWHLGTRRPIRTPCTGVGTSAQPFPGSSACPAARHGDNEQGGNEQTVRVDVSEQGSIPRRAAGAGEELGSATMSARHLGFAASRSFSLCSAEHRPPPGHPLCTGAWTRTPEPPSPPCPPPITNQHRDVMGTAGLVGAEGWSSSAAQLARKTPKAEAETHGWVSKPSTGAV